MGNTYGYYAVFEQVKAYGYYVMVEQMKACE